MERKERVLAGVAVLIGLVAIAPLVVEAALPRLIMVHGGIVDGRVIIDDAAGIQAIMDWDDSRDVDLETRPYANLTLFWAVLSDEENSPFNWMDKAAGDLVPEDAEPTRAVTGIPLHGRFYPACGAMPAVISLETVAFDGSFRPIDVIRTWAPSGEALTLFEGHGIQIEATCSQ